MYIESFEVCFSLLHCNFLFSPKNPCNPFKKLTCSIIQPLFKIKISWPTTGFFTKLFLAPSLDHFGRWLTCHYITKSAVSQTNNKSSDNDSMTVEFYKNVYLDLSPKQFQMRILGDKKILKKPQIGWRQILVPSLLSRNKGLIIAVKNYTKADFRDS